LALGVILAKRNKVKGALIFLNQPYEGRNDKLHWLGIDLFIWIVDKFYMPVATASCSLIADGNNQQPVASGGYTDIHMNERININALLAVSHHFYTRRQCC
jgi:hypothetical protein